MILIVDNDSAMAAGLERMLRYSGQEAVSTPSAMEALSLLHLRTPKLIILDIGLAVPDGLTLLRAIRSDPAYDEVPVLVYTADIGSEREKEARRAGAQEYMVKGTIGWEALVQRIVQLIGEGGTRLRMSE